MKIKNKNFEKTLLTLISLFFAMYSPLLSANERECIFSEYCPEGKYAKYEFPIEGSFKDKLENYYNSHHGQYLAARNNDREFSKRINTPLDAYDYIIEKMEIEIVAIIKMIVKNDYLSSPFKDVYDLESANYAYFILQRRIDYISTLKYTDTELANYLGCPASVISELKGQIKESIITTELGVKRIQECNPQKTCQFQHLNNRVYGYFLILYSLESFDPYETSAYLFPIKKLYERARDEFRADYAGDFNYIKDYYKEIFDIKDFREMYRDLPTLNVLEKDYYNKWKESYFTLTPKNIYKQ